MVEKIYAELDLHAFSGQKLFRASWKMQALGIRELTEMKCYEPEDFQHVLSRASNKTLQEEIFMATVRLDKQHPLDFLNRFDGKISPWMRINLHHHLQSLDSRSLPDFSPWFQHPSEDVVLFSISMARQFRQMSAIPSLIPVLHHSNPVIVASAIRALGELDAFEVVDEIVAVTERHWQNEKIGTSVVRYLKRVGHLDEHLNALGKYLEHPDFHVRLETVKAMANGGAAASDRLNLRNQQTHGSLEALIRHAREPLLQ
jgi:hypothetical protein